MAFNACEWGQVRRAQASTIGGRIVMLRPAIVSQAIIVRPNSPITHVQALRHRPIAVNFHAGSHYLTLPLLEGFMEREAITVVHVGQAPGRYRALWEGRVDAVDGDGALHRAGRKAGVSRSGRSILCWRRNSFPSPGHRDCYRRVSGHHTGRRGHQRRQTPVPASPHC